MKEGYFMKKRYTLIAIASIILLSSVALMINKNSFADPNDLNQCLNQIHFVVDNEEEVYVKNENNRIDLPMVDSIDNQNQHPR